MVYKIHAIFFKLQRNKYPVNIYMFRANNSAPEIDVKYVQNQQ